MDRLKELKEAKLAAEASVVAIDHAIESLESAKSWGFWDLMGGEFFSSWMKRRKINQANEGIAEIKRSLVKLSDELEDIDMAIPTEISDTFADNFFDIWFDNIFTDFMVQKKIKNTLVELRNFRDKLLTLISALNLEISNLE